MDALPDASQRDNAHRAAGLDLDDAFSESDAHELVYQFSPEAVREDMARNMPPMAIEDSWATEDSMHATAFSEAHNLSFSSIDLDGNGQISRFHSPSRSHSPELPDHLSHISLDNHEGTEDKEQKMTDKAERAYPDIVIDVAMGETYTHHIASAPDLEQQQYRAERQIALVLPPFEYPPDTAASTQSLPAQAIAPQTSHVPERPSSATPTTFQPSSTPIPATAPVLSLSSTPQSQSKKPYGHRPTRSTGPSAFEKVRSKTRPIFLPPKPRQEDDKHMASWQSMMKQSRISAEKRRKALQERRLSREKQIEDSIHTWEKDIVPDWTAVHKNSSLRKLWWKGIPSKLRAPMWERAVGNSLALSKDHYRTCLARAKKALLSGVFPPLSLGLIEEDISTTLPSLHIFHPQTGPLYEDLKGMLCAWVVSRSDEGLGYTIGAAKIAAMLLINMPAPQGFVVMRNFLERHCMRSFYGGEGSHEDVEAYYRIFDTLLADGMPKIYFNFKQHQISPAAYLNEWLLPLFLDHLPFEACARVWDVLLLEGDSFLFRAALGILAVLEPRLFFPDRKELMELLKGENKAALEVAKRDGQPLDGGRYEIYGVDEETLWERIDQMNEWWKESTWTRLLQRELPDI